MYQMSLRCYVKEDVPEGLNLPSFCCRHHKDHATRLLIRCSAAVTAFVLIAFCLCRISLLGL